MTPKEVGIFLQALGYPPATYVYIAAGEIFGGETYLSDLRSRFPNLVFKVLSSCVKLCSVQTMLLILPAKVIFNFSQETLATEEELKKPKCNTILVESKAIIIGNVFPRMKKGQNY